MKSLYIKNYKNLRELSIDSLARVNLIVGCNNVGKSTLLEAVSIYLANGNDEWLKTILDFRGEMVNVDSAKGDVDFSQVLSEHYSSLFSGRKMDFRNATAISIGEQSDLLNIKLVHIAEEQRGGTVVRWVYNDDDADSGEHLFRYIGDGLSVVSGSNAPMLIPFFRRGFPGNVKDRVPFEYVLAQDFHLRKNVLLFDRISLSDREGYVLDALRIIEPSIDRLNFLNENEYSNRRVPFVTLKDTGERVRLSSMGDGINRILTVILALVNCKGGVFLLDEFETGLHYTVQTQLWRVIFMLSEKLNVQVFATSHSHDCINSFIAVNRGGQIIRLDNRGGEIVAVNYSDDKEMEFIAQNGVEIR